jgi:hypothetical protein
MIHPMTGIEDHLPLGRLTLPVLPAVVAVNGWVAWIDTCEVGVHLLKAAEHLIERVILEHQENDVLYRVFGLLMGIHGRMSLNFHGSGIAVPGPPGADSGAILQAVVHFLQEGNEGRPTPAT